MDTESRNRTWLLCSLFGGVFFIGHRAHLGIDWLAGSILAEVADNHPVPLVQSRKYLNSIGTLDSRMNLALFHHVLGIDQKYQGLVFAAIDRLQGEGERVRVILYSQRNIGIH